MSLAIQLKGHFPKEWGIFTLQPTTETESITEICVEYNDNFSCLFLPFYPYNKQGEFIQSFQMRLNSTTKMTPKFLQRQSKLNNYRTK